MNGSSSWRLRAGPLKNARVFSVGGLPLSGFGRTLAGRMVTFFTSPEFLMAVLAMWSVALVALVVWLLRAGPSRRERGGELDLTRAAARGELASFEWDWPSATAASEMRGLEGSTPTGASLREG